MKKNTLLYILLVVLLLANGFFLFKHFGDKKGHRAKGERGQHNYIARQLDFNESQLKKYQELKTPYREIMKKHNDDIRLLKDEFFSHISNENASESQIDSIANLISKKEKSKDIGTFNYFKEVRKLCNDEQKEQFSSIIKNALKKRSSRGRGVHSPRH
jgi:hypothetical protein